MMKVAKITYKEESSNSTHDVWVTKKGRIAQDRYYDGVTSQYRYRYDSESLGCPEMGERYYRSRWLQDLPGNREYSTLEWVEIDLPEGFDRFPYIVEEDSDFEPFFPALIEREKAAERDRLPYLHEVDPRFKPFFPALIELAKTIKATELAKATE